MEGDDVKGIQDARVLRNLMCFMVCVDPDLANMARLVSVCNYVSVGKSAQRNVRF